ncbi:hypothetical protein EVAR_91931_1 [Eumeta japonica]|uniref:Uncharacterized protein n=1 Tax=Eumeta variegata TaxID=151549 RepID=A0A4C1TIQ4_EUMVA|nr:hypothetical protein EVAR_91931_1 [Eumeta japonica]
MQGSDDRGMRSETDLGRNLNGKPRRCIKSAGVKERRAGGRSPTEGRRRCVGRALRALKASFTLVMFCFAARTVTLRASGERCGRRIEENRPSKRPLARRSGRVRSNSYCRFCLRTALTFSRRRH